jgi:predicted N-acetyltransferase YhbS
MVELIEIEYLADHPGAIPVLASWLYQEWGYRSPDGAPSGMEEMLKSRLNRDRLPLALVALEGESPAGTVSLKVRELDSRPQYPYWLGSLYVPPEFRRRGIGSQLVLAAEQTAGNLGIERLYLYTRRAENEALYANLGWARVEELVYEDRSAVILRKRIEID